MKNGMTSSVNKGSRNPYKTYISCFNFNYNDEIPAGATIEFSGLIPIADINFIFLS